MVIHCFIDSKSRYVTGIRVSNNNRASTVFDLFQDVIHNHGVPSRVRGDHGTENLMVAQWMEENMGVDRGSYIWGRSVILFPFGLFGIDHILSIMTYRSVHNTWIERLWYHITHAFGQKWKNFFLDLETHHSLNPRAAEHVWLLHHLFLDAVNQDAQEWAHAWNSHHLQIRGERERSPRDIFIFSMLQDGPRGVQRLTTPTDKPVDDLASHGIDWDVTDDHRLMNHLLWENPQAWEDDNPFSSGPVTASHVPCEPPDCPFSTAQVLELDTRLGNLVDVSSRNMHIRHMVWVEALEICTFIYQT